MVLTKLRILNQGNVGPPRFGFMVLTAIHEKTRERTEIFADDISVFLDAGPLARNTVIRFVDLDIGAYGISNQIYLNPDRTQFGTLIPVSVNGVSIRPGAHTPNALLVKEPVIIIPEEIDEQIEIEIIPEKKGLSTNQKLAIGGIVLLLV